MNPLDDVEIVRVEAGHYGIMVTVKRDRSMDEVAQGCAHYVQKYSRIEKFLIQERDEHFDLFFYGRVNNV